jgi:DNA-binding transcriptional MerR regulator
MPQVIQMTSELKAKIAKSVESFHLPRYSEIPNVGLYLEQTTQYINEYLAPLGEYSLTGSMVSNYVKKGLIDSPVKKRYSREQIAHLFFIAVAKSILSLDMIAEFIQLQRRTYSHDRAYNFFCGELESLLQFTFELRDDIPAYGEETSDEKRMLFSCITAVTQKIYLEKALAAIAAECE